MGQAVVNDQCTLVQTLTARLRPDGLTSTHDDVSAQLRWNENNEADLTGYNVYRDSMQGNYTRIATVTEPAYMDTTIVVGRPSY